MASSGSWWGSKARQFRSHLQARVEPAERAALATWMTTPQLELFDRMHVADRRHGLDVLRAVDTSGTHDPDLRIAAVLHDAGKGRVGVWPRVAYSLGQAYGAWIWRAAGLLPGMSRALDRLRDHAAASARLAAEAGASDRAVELIRHQDDPPQDDEAGRLLRLADEAN